MNDENEEQSEGEDPVFNLDYRRYLDALRKYFWAVIAIMALMITGAVIYTNRQTEIYQAVASVQIEPRIPDLLGQGQEELYTGGVSSDYYNQQRQVLGSYSLIRQTVDQHRLYLKVLSEPERANRKVDEMIDAATVRIRGELSAKYPDQDRIMYVVVRNSNPQTAADIANAHIATYIEYSKGLLSTDTKQASSALTTEFDDAETKLRTAEAALYQYQKDNDLLAVTLEERQSMVSSGITTYTTKLTEAHGRHISLAAQLDRMQHASQQDVLQSPILSMGGGDKSAFDSLRAQYYAERNKFIELDKEVGPKNPQYQMQKAKTDDLHGALETEAKRMVAAVNEQLQAVSAEESALKSEVEKATKEAIALGPKVVEYNDLLRKKKSQEDRYNILRTRLSTTDLTGRMSRSMDTTNVKPLDAAQVPLTPVSPNLRSNIMAAVALSLALGTALIFLIVFLDRSIKSTDDAQQAAGAPILGIIPMLEDSELDHSDIGARDLFVHKNPTSLVAECCRSLRTNIMFSAADRQIKTIVVSSANQGEGKTTSVMYLGTTMAQSGQRVLLVDTDMRRPRLHISTGVSRQVGLSNLLVGDQDYDDVIKTTEIPNLFVLPCGPTPPNPAELLMSQRFETVIAELGKRFDRIILDSPPLQVVTDGVVLSKHADGMILIVKAGQTLREELKRSARHVRNVRGTIFGVIVNGIEPDSRSGYSYYSYYGYTEKSPEPQS
ncbi:exopolysaccharide regulatory tyrosine autokinase VpsO [soil metagenome]